MNQSKIIKLSEGKIYPGIDHTYFGSSALAKKIKGRKMIIERIYTRMGATARSFNCTFLPTTTRQKPFHHTFTEFEKIQNLIITNEKSDLSPNITT
jgi:hypothetical protein